VYEKNSVAAYSVLYLKIEEEEKQKNDRTFQRLAWGLC
jgi:hypothetical protein